MLLLVRGKFNLFCFFELSFSVYQLVEFGFQYYSVFFCVVSNLDCYKENVFGRGGNYMGMEKRNEVQEFYLICIFLFIIGDEMVVV